MEADEIRRDSYTPSIRPEEMFQTYQLQRMDSMISSYSNDSLEIDDSPGFNLDKNMNKEKETSHQVSRDENGRTNLN